MMKEQNELNEFTFRRTGSTGCEILYEGVVVAWTVDETWATLIVARMNNDPCDTVGAGEEMPEAACCCCGPTNGGVIAPSLFDEFRAKRRAELRLSK